MCARLKFNDFLIEKGEWVRVRGPKGETRANWSGFCQIGKRDWWKTQSRGVEVQILADEFTEGDNQYYVDGQMQGLGLNENVEVYGRIIGERGEVKIFTRSAITAHEQSVHSRWPLVRLENGDVQVWEASDE